MSRRDPSLGFCRRVSWLVDSLREVTDALQRRLSRSDQLLTLVATIYRRPTDRPSGKARIGKALVSGVGPGNVSE